MAAVCAYVSGSGFSCVLRSRWPHEIQFPELDLHVAGGISSVLSMSVSASIGSSPTLGMDCRAKSDAGCRGVQREIVLHPSDKNGTIWAGFLPIHGRTRRILRWGVRVL